MTEGTRRSFGERKIVIRSAKKVICDFMKNGRRDVMQFLVEAFGFVLHVIEQKGWSNAEAEENGFFFLSPQDMNCPKSISLSSSTALSFQTRTGKYCAAPFRRSP